MAFRVLALCFILISTMTSALARKPAVEDFVGIEVVQAEGAATPFGSEVLYNLEQDLGKINDQKKKPVATIQSAPKEAFSSGSMTIVALIFLVALPLLVWAMMMNHLKRKATKENASNIELLEKYRKERVKKSEESNRKAS